MLIKNLRILDPATNKDCIGELNIEGSRVPTLPQLPDGSLDGSGYIVMPGLVDIHTHFREPGATDSEIIQTGMAAAIAGGFSIVTTMPNTTPAADNEAILRFQIEEAEKCLDKGMELGIAQDSVFMVQGELAHISGNYTEALSKFEQTILQTNDTQMKKRAVLLSVNRKSFF